MKKLLVVIATLFTLMSSVSAFAAELNDADIKRIEKEVSSMAEFMKLSASEEKKITDLKKELTLENRAAVAEYGRGTKDYKKARRKAMKAYQGELFKIITKQEMKEWRQAKAG